MKPLYLIDASVYVFRAYFSLPITLVDLDGFPANAVYGFADFLARLLDATKAEHVGVAFDESLTTSFRNEIYPAYKANRELPPPELEAQLESCQELASALGLATFVSKRYEADDLIGSLAARMRPKGFSAVFVSSDKDLMQLLHDGDVWWNFARDERLGADGVQERFGVAPAQIVDLIALAGDKVDNIPGVPGVGLKTAAALLNHFGSLDAVYAGLEEVSALPLRGAKSVQAALEKAKDQAYLSQRLARIALDAPVELGPEALARQPTDRAWLVELCDRLQFGEAIRNKLRVASGE